MLLLLSVLKCYFEKVSLTSFISTSANLLQHFIFARFLLREDYGECALRKEPVIGRCLKQLRFEKSYKESYIELPWSY